MDRELLKTDPMPDKNPPKPGDLFYHIEGKETLGTYFGIAYQVQDPPVRAKVVATAVSSNSMRVKALLRTKLKAKGLTPP